MIYTLLLNEGEHILIVNDTALPTIGLIMLGSLLMS